MDVVTGTRPGDRSPSGTRTARGPRARIDAATIPPAGERGHGVRAVLRRQPVRLVDGRAEGGYTNVFEVICPDCGDHPWLDYCEVIPRLQRLRGPRALAAGLAEYDRHLGLTG